MTSGSRPRVLLPRDTVRIVGTVHTKGKVYVQVVLKDGRPKTIRAS